MQTNKTRISSCQILHPQTDKRRVSLQSYNSDRKDCTVISRWTQHTSSPNIEDQTYGFLQNAVPVWFKEGKIRVKLYPPIARHAGEWGIFDTMRKKFSLRHIESDVYQTVSNCATCGCSREKIKETIEHAFVFCIMTSKFYRDGNARTNAAIQEREYICRSDDAQKAEDHKIFLHITDHCHAWCQSAP